MHFFEEKTKKVAEKFGGTKNSRTFATAYEK